MMPLTQCLLVGALVLAIGSYLVIPLIIVGVCITLEFLRPAL